jgi:hypothetical protein
MNCNFYKNNIRALCAIIGLLWFSCGFQQEAGSGSEAGNSSRIAFLNDSLFIKIPTSATSDSSTTLSKTSLKTEGESLNGYYASIRAYIGFANELVHNNEFGLKRLIGVYRDSLPWAIIEKHQMMSGTIDGSRWVASYSNNNMYHYQLSIYVDSMAHEKLAFSLAFNGNEAEPKGKSFYRIDLIEKVKTRGAISILVEFEGKGDERKLDLSLTSQEILDDTLDGFRNLKINLFEKSNVLHISGASYHPNIQDLLPDTFEYCYEFYGFSDTLKNQSILYIGVPPATINNAEFSIFSEYDLSSVISKRFIRKDILTLNDTIKQCVVTSYTDSLTLQEIFDSIVKTGDISWLRPVDKLDSITMENFNYFLELNKNSTNADLVSILWLKQLKQPVYFNNRGYAGNGLVAPEEFTTLASTGRILTLQNPWQIKNLIVEAW